MAQNNHNHKFKIINAGTTWFHLQQISIDKLTWLLEDNKTRRLRKKTDIWNSNRDEDWILYEREKKQATNMFNLNEIKRGRACVWGRARRPRAYGCSFKIQIKASVMSVM